MRVVRLAILLLLMNVSLYAQSANKVWAFGWGCGIDFNTTPPTPFVSSANAYEGCASISNSSGQLLMYTTGDTVYNRLGVPMPNGGNILGTSAVIGSCTQGSLIVPKPDSDSLFYVFALQGITDGLPAGKLFYSVVDMSLDGGYGDVIPGEKLVQLDGHLGEKMTAVAGTCNNVWIIVCPQSSDEFRAYEITSSGISSAPVISPIAGSSPSFFDIGVLKASHKGDKLIAALYSGSKCQLFDFDRGQGLVTNPIDFTNGPVANPYTASFSPDDSKLYLVFDSLYQYDLSLSTTSAILSSRKGIASITIGTEIIGDIQAAPDGKIYLSKMGSSSVAAINSPNLLGIACDFNPVSIVLPAPASVGIGLPNAVVNAATTDLPRIITHDTLVCEPLQLASSSVSGSYLWSTGDTVRSINVATPGVYWVYASAGCGTIDTFNLQAKPLADFINDVDICYGDSIGILVSVAATATAGILWSTGSTDASINIKDTGVYWVNITDGLCSQSDTMNVAYIGCGCEFLFPNAFSPNGDGLNDYFLPVYNDQQCNGLETYTLQIFNRWGERVYIGTHKDKGWDGFFREKTADVGVYMFQVNYQDAQQKKYSRKGDLTLVR